MYIFVIVFIPTTGSPAAHFGMDIIVDDCMLSAALGNTFATNIPEATSNITAIRFNSFSLQRARVAVTGFPTYLVRSGKTAG
jgi:hypothetical protein